MMRLLQYMSVPQRVIGNDVSAGRQFLQHHLIIFNILPLVTIYKRQIESNVHGRQQLQRITYIKLNLAGVRRAFQPGACKVLLLIVYLECVQHGSLFQAFGQAKRGVTAVSPYLQHLAGTYHPHKHFQHTPLQVPGSHAGT